MTVVKIMGIFVELLFDRGVVVSAVVSRFFNREHGHGP